MLVRPKIESSVPRNSQTGLRMAVARNIKERMEQGSWIRRMFEEGMALQQQYGPENVFDLSIGNPVMDPPQQFYDELRRLADDPIPGMHRYMPNAGYTETRAAIASQLGEETGIDFTAEEVVMACGAGGALNIVLKALLDPGDEVIIFAPYFPEYQVYADNHGGICTVVPPTEDFLPDMAAFEASFNEHTKVVLFCSPGNPTGVLYDAELLTDIGAVIRRKEEDLGREIFLVSDEPYRKILFDGLEYPHIFPYHERSIVATSHSKDLAIPGERIGFVVVNPEYQDSAEVVDGLIYSNRSLGFVNASALMQHIVKSLQSVTVDVMAYQSKRDFLYGNLVEMGYDIVRPQGAFYLFPRSPVEDEIEFVAELQKHRVLVVPGRGFGMPGYFRISYCLTDATLEGSLPGFKAAIEKYRG